MENIVSVWKAPPTGIVLSEKEVHIWRSALDLPCECIRSLMEKLSLDEKGKAKRFRFDRDRKRFIAGVGILRIILGRYLSVEPDELRFLHGKYGKPRVFDEFGNELIHFNMSHSEGLALYGFSRKHEIGVDIQRIQPIPEMDQIVESYFCAKEKEKYFSCSTESREEYFFKIWARKEAVLKANGSGLLFPAERLNVCDFLDERKADLEETPFLIYDLGLMRGYSAAVAIVGIHEDSTGVNSSAET